MFWCFFEPEGSGKIRECHKRYLLSSVIIYVIMYGEISHLGAEMIGLHLISPLSKNLFQKAILLDSSGLNPNLPEVVDYFPAVVEWGISTCLSNHKPILL